MARVREVLKLTVATGEAYLKYSRDLERFEKAPGGTDAPTFPSTALEKTLRPALKLTDTPAPVWAEAGTLDGEPSTKKPRVVAQTMGRIRTSVPYR